VGRVLGVDLDNTIVRCDGLFHAVAVERGLAPGRTPRDKRTVRDAVRAGPGGEPAWQELQARVYGPRLAEAPPAPGARAALAAWRADGARVAVVSHKTTRAAADPRGADLRAAARAWLAAHEFLAPAGPIDPGDVFFEDTRADKLARIARLGCLCFVDDLAETFAEPGFPAGVARILYAPQGTEAAGPGVEVFGDWTAIGRRVGGLLRATS